MRYALTVALFLATGLSGQEMMPGTARPLIKDMPAATSGYICPMHPNEVKAEPGSCSICGMTLVAGDPMATADYVLRVTTEPRAPKAGHYMLFADFMPVGGGPQMLASPLITAGFDGDIASSVPALVADKTWSM